MRYIFLIILVVALVYNLPKLLHPATPSDEVVKDDFYSLVINNASGSSGLVKNPNGWVIGGFNLVGLTGEYRARIADFKITRSPPEISVGTIGIRGQKIYLVEIYKKIEREYTVVGDPVRINQMLPKSESSRVRCYYYQTKDGKWTHTPPARI